MKKTHSNTKKILLWGALLVVGLVIIYNVTKKKNNNSNLNFSAPVDEPPTKPFEPTAPTVPVPPIVPVPPNPPTGTPKSGGILPFLFSGVTPETQPETFSPEKIKGQTFATDKKTRKGRMAKVMNSLLGVEIPSVLMILHTDLSRVYQQKGIDLQDAGFFGSVDNLVHLAQGTEYKFFPWGDFVTSLPFVKRLKAFLAPFGAEFLSFNDAQVIDKANQIAYNTYFGNVIQNGKSQEVYTVVDCEGGGENGENTHNFLLLLKTMQEKFAGIFGLMYLEVVKPQLGYETKVGYPDANGNLKESELNPVFTANLNGWKAVDYKLLAPMPELAHYGETAYGTYNDGVRQLTPYGANKTNEHYLQRSVSMAEKNYYAYKRLGGSDLVIMQSKLICDRGGTGWKYSDGSRRFGGGGKTILTQYLTRDQAFKETLGVIMSGCHHNEWNRPVAGLIADAYNGYDAVNELLKLEYQVADNEWVSLSQMRTGNFEFSLWNAQYKLDGESTWRKEDGYDLGNHQDNLLVRFLKKDNYVAVFVADPYNEATKKDNLSVKWGTFEKTYSINDWQSCYADQSTKDYIFAIYKLS